MKKQLVKIYITLRMDGIPALALKATGDTINNITHVLINQVWYEEIVPKEWNKWIIIMLPKKGDITLRKIEEE